MRHGWIALLAAIALSAPALAQPLRGRVEARSFTPQPGHTVLFNVYLPEHYDTSTQRYPVVYHLHGLGGSQTGPHNTAVPRSFEAALDQGLIGPVIVVFPNGYTDAWWADSIAGNKPAESDVVDLLIPHLDATFRTIPTRGARVIQGFSMGGFGTAKFYSKFPDLFVCCIEYDGALVTWTTMLQAHPQLAQEIFGNSEAYFDEYNPRRWFTDHAPILRLGPPVRMVVGALLGGNRQFRDFLATLQVPRDYVETGCAHDLTCLMNSQGVASAAFIASHLDLACTPCDCDPDLNQDGNADQDDVAYLINAVGGGPNPTGIDPDFNRDGNADQDDVSALIGVLAGEACP
jgi:S-formylglutathione hydrolase FrmB